MIPYIISLVFWGCILAGAVWYFVRKEKKLTDVYIEAMEKEYKENSDFGKE